MVILIPFHLANRNADTNIQRKRIIEADENKNQKIYVQVIQSNFELNDNYLTVVGNLVTEKDYQQQLNISQAYPSYFQIMG